MTPLIEPTQPAPTEHKRTIAVRLLALAVAAGLVAAACGSDDTAGSSSSGPEPTNTTTTTATTGESSTTTEPQPTTSSTATPSAELVEVNVDELGVTTAVPGDWVQAPVGTFSDGISQLSVIALPTSDPATSAALDGYQPIGEVVAGFDTWSLYTLETGGAVEGVAVTEIGDFTYGVVLLAPAELAEQHFETVVFPALEAFEVGEAPDSTLASGTIEIDGRTVAYATGGTGDTTVVFEAGLGNDMQSWALVAPAIAEQSRLFAYDRPGYGASDLTDSSRDGATMVAELQELLMATGHEPPYVMVGHSLGGTLVDLYTRTYPDDVAAVVLIDSRHHEFTARCLAQLAEADCGIPTDDDLAQLGHPSSDEWLGLETTSQQLTQAPAFPDLPLAVIVRGKPDSTTPAFEELWHQTQQDYAAMVPGTQVIVADNSDHHIPGRQPELVIDTIIQLLQTQR